MDFAPSGQLEMMVQRGHFEYALFSQLIGANLITDNASITKMKPIKISNSSVRVITEIPAMAPPRARDPVSPMKIFAGW